MRLAKYQRSKLLIQELYFCLPLFESCWGRHEKSSRKGCFLWSVQRLDAGGMGLLVSVIA